MASSSTQRMTDCASGNGASVGSARRVGGGGSCFQGAGRRVLGQKHAEAGCVTSRRPDAAEVNCPIVLLNNSFADPQTQPGALGRLGTEERLKQLFRRLGVDA